MLNSDLRERVHDRIDNRRRDADVGRPLCPLASDAVGIAHGRRISRQRALRSSRTPGHAFSLGRSFALGRQERAVMDVVVWLRSLGLGKYEAAFR